MRKQCRKCGIDKPVEEFHVQPRGVLGRHSYCKSCLREYRRAWNKANPAAVLEQKRRHRATHKEQIKEYKRRKYHEDIERSREQQRRWRRLNPDKVLDRELRTADTRRWAYIKHRHGLTPEQFMELWQQQHGECAICHSTLVARRLSKEEIDAGLRPAHVDHCHESGRIRGLLCGRCNQALGLCDDEPARLRAAADYLDATRLAPSA